jgi:hypothetical protein
MVESNDRIFSETYRAGSRVNTVELELLCGFGRIPE